MTFIFEPKRNHDYSSTDICLKEVHGQLGTFTIIVYLATVITGG